MAANTGGTAVETKPTHGSIAGGTVPTGFQQDPTAQGAGSPEGRTFVDPSGGSQSSKTTNIASPSDEGSSTQPPDTQVSCTADPGVVIISFVGGQAASSQAASEGSGSDSDPTSARTTDAGGVLASLLRGGSGDSDVQSAAEPSSNRASGDLSLTGGPAASPALVLAGATVTPDSSGKYVIGSATLVAGSSAVVVGGTTYSLDLAPASLLMARRNSFLRRRLASPYQLRL